MRFLSLTEVLELHHRIVEQSGGAEGVRELGGIQSAIAQPQMTFGGNDLYPTIESKASALCFSLLPHHPACWSALAITLRKSVDSGKSRMYTLVLNCVATFQFVKPKDFLNGSTNAT